MLSLRTRLLLAASLVLLVFIGLCGAGLEKAFRDSALAAQQERMRGLVYALLGAAEQDARGAIAIGNEKLPEPRLRQPDSGLEAALLNESGAELWRSPSVTASLPLIIGPEVGAWKFERLDEAGSFVLSFGLRWIAENNTPQPAGRAAAGFQRYTALVIEEPQAYEAQLLIFRRTLWSWLLSAAAGLLIALLLVQRWGLAPVQRLAGDLSEVEKGAKSEIDSRYPRELTPLASALNAMIRSERSQQTRYRNALADLAHSLKTPLAVLRGLDPHPQAESFNEQLSRMQQIVDHQLGKAATAGRRALAQPVALLPVADKVIAALRKVYAGKTLAFETGIALDLQLRMDGGDLYELLGNLLDNGAKWARSRVLFRANRHGAAVVLDIEDDGAGFPDDAEPLLRRGVRADSKYPGQGLGLAAVAEMVKAYEGRIELGRSAALNGARVTVTIPV